jgi:hypothetical protein
MIIKSIKIRSFWMSPLPLGHFLEVVAAEVGTRQRRLQPQLLRTPFQEGCKRVRSLSGPRLLSTPWARPSAPQAPCTTRKHLTLWATLRFLRKSPRPLSKSWRKVFTSMRLRGQLSAAQIELRAISDLSVNNLPTVNVLTTLQEQRLKTLVSMGSTVAAASSQSVMRF